MATTRIKDITTAATTFSSDDFVAIDGATSGTRKMAKDDLITEVSSGVSGTYLEESNNLSDVASKDTSKQNLEVPDVGTAPNEVPLNGMLGSMAYQSADSVSMGTVEITDKVDGSLGINTSPTATLEVTDATTNVAAVRVTRRSDLASTYAELGTTGGSGEVRSTDNLVLSADYDNNGSGSAIQFKVDGTEKAVIDSSGNINHTVGAGGANYDITCNNHSAFGSSAVVDSRIRSENIGSSNAYASNLVFYTNNTSNVLTEAARFSEAGHLEFPSGQGIDLGATVLSEFEQGVFTASLAPATSGTLTIDTASDQLAYAIVGDIVTVHGQIALDGASSPVGNYVKINLPAAIALGTLSEDADYSAGSCVVTSAAGNLGDYSLLAVGGDSFVRIYKNTASTFGATAADFNGDESIYISITYRKA